VKDTPENVEERRWEGGSQRAREKAAVSRGP